VPGMVGQIVMSMQPPNPVDSSFSGGGVDFATWLAEVNHELPADYSVGREPAKWVYLDCMVKASEMDFGEENQQLTTAELVFYPSGYRTMPQRKRYELRKATAIEAAREIRNFLKRGELPSVVVR
jgi:hypothetical protein